MTPRESGGGAAGGGERVPQTGVRLADMYPDTQTDTYSNTQTCMSSQSEADGGRQLSWGRESGERRGVGGGRERKRAHLGLQTSSQTHRQTHTQTHRHA